MFRTIGNALARSAEYAASNDTTTAAGKGAQLAYTLFGGKQKQLGEDLEGLQQIPQRNIPNDIQQFSRGVGKLDARNKVVNYLNTVLKNHPNLELFTPAQLDTLQNAGNHALKLTQRQAFRRNAVYPALSLGLGAAIIGYGNHKINEWNQKTINLTNQLREINEAKDRFDQSASDARVRSSQ